MCCARVDGVRARSGCSLGWEGKLTIVSTSMVASTTHTATSIFTSVERPEATSMVSMVSMMPPTQLEAVARRGREGSLSQEKR